MTINFRDRPNHIRMTGDILFGAHFGELRSVVPVSIHGNGHEPHIHLGFVGPLDVNITPALAAELVRRLPEALAALPRLPDVSGSVWQGEL